MIKIYLPVAKQRTFDQLQEEGIFGISSQVARNTEDNFPISWHLRQSLMQLFLA